MNNVINLLGTLPGP